MTAKRLLVIISASVGVVILGWVALIGAVYAWGGVATVRIHEQQEGINIVGFMPQYQIHFYPGLFKSLGKHQNGCQLQLGFNIIGFQFSNDGIGSESTLGISEF